MVRINSQGVMTVETRIENAALFIKLFIQPRRAETATGKIIRQNLSQCKDFVRYAMFFR